MNKYKYDLDVFYREDALSYYLLGAWFSDGNVDVRSNRILPRISSCDLDWLSLIRDKICPELKIIHRRNGCYDLNIYSTELGRWFISKGCKPNKSLTVELPTIPSLYLPDFLRGCIDGDGSIGYYKHSKYNSFYRRCYLCSGSAAFISSFANILDNRRLKYHKEILHPDMNKKNFIRKNTFYKIILNGKNAVDFLQWIYYPSNPLAMPRKEVIVKTIINSQ
jgi:hypothetical protein